MLLKKRPGFRGPSPRSPWADFAGEGGMFSPAKLAGRKAPGSGGRRRAGRPCSGGGRCSLSVPSCGEEEERSEPFELPALGRRQSRQRGARPCLRASPGGGGFSRLSAARAEREFRASRKTSVGGRLQEIEAASAPFLAMKGLNPESTYLRWVKVPFGPLRGPCAASGDVFLPGLGPA